MDFKRSHDEQVAKMQLLKSKSISETL